MSLVRVVGGGNVTNHTLQGHPKVALVASAYILLAGATHMGRRNFKRVGKYNLTTCPGEK